MNDPYSRAEGARGAQASGHALVDLQQVTKVFHTPAGDFPALRGVDLQVESGELVSIVGKSGSGKSTLINMVTGIDHPTSGKVVIGGTAVHELDEEGVALWRGRTIGVIFQFFQLLPTLTAVENVLLPMDYLGLYTPAERTLRAMVLLELVGMVDDAHRFPAELSGGKLQRVAIARALANDPPLIAADEPTGNLDSRTSDSVFGLFEHLVDVGKTVLMVTHDRDLAHRCRREVVLADGLVVDSSTAD